MLDTNLRSEPRLGIDAPRHRQPRHRARWCAGANRPRCRPPPGAPPASRDRCRGFTPTPSTTTSAASLRPSSSSTASAVNPTQLGSQMKPNALRFVQLLHEPAHLRTHDALERHAIEADHVDFEIARAQRGGDFQPDEAGTDDHGATCLGGRVDDGLRVRQACAASSHAVARRLRWAASRAPSRWPA